MHRGQIIPTIRPSLRMGSHFSERGESSGGPGRLQRRQFVVGSAPGKVRVGDRVDAAPSTGWRA
jgi:hypothetical protein